MLRRTLLAALPLAAQAPAAPLLVAPEKPFPGSPILFSLAEGPASGTWMDRPLSFAQDAKSKRWVALAAVNYELKAGPQILELGGGGKHTVQIAPHLYRTGRLTVPPRFVSPPKAVLKRIAEEREIKKTAFATRAATAAASPPRPPAAAGAQAAPL